MNISLCVMVKDETEELKNCLSSFEPLVKEILILDTGNNDKIKSIAKKFDAKRFPFKWVDDFALARNEILSKAEEEWVMMVDADDRIEKEALVELKNKCEKLKNSTDVISLPYLYHKSENAIGNSAYVPRLWKRSLNLKYIYPIHEYLDFSEIDKNKTEKLNIPIIHDKKPTDFSKSFERNLIIIKKYLQDHPKDLRMLYYFIHDSQQLKNYKEVIWGAQKYLAAGPQNYVKLYKVLIRKGKAHFQLKEITKAQEAFLMAIAVNPLFIEAYLELGDFYKKQKLFLEAEHFYRCALLCKKPQTTFDFHNEALYDYFAMQKLSFLLREMGKNAEALAYAKNLLKYYPQDEKLKEHIKILESLV